MRTQKIQVLTGTMLSLLLSAASIYPATARSVGESKSGQLISQTNTTPGNANPSPSDTSPTTPGNANPRPNDTSPTTPSNTSSPTDTGASQGSTTIKGTVKTISGNVVTLQLPDGSTRDITFSSGDVQRLKLKQGTPISVVLDSQDKPIKVVTTRSGTTSSTEVTTTRRRTTTTGQTVKTTPTRSQNPQPTAATTTINAKPVRGLW